jgi:integrase
MKKLPSVAALISEFMDIHGQRLQISSRKGYVNNFRLHLSDRLLTNWREELPKLREHLAKRGNCASTIRQKISQIRRFFLFLVRWYGLDERAIDLFPYVESRPAQKLVIGHEDIRDCLRHCLKKSCEAWQIASLIAVTGMRSLEALALSWEEVDLAAGVISLTDTRRRRLKTLGSRREIPLVQVARNLLESRPGDREGAVFNLSYPSFLRAFPDGIRPRDLRRAFASALADGIRLDESNQAERVHPLPIWRIARLLGHSKLNTLFYYYGKGDGVPCVDPDFFR